MGPETEPYSVRRTSDEPWGLLHGANTVFANRGEVEIANAGRVRAKGKGGMSEFSIQGLPASARGDRLSSPRVKTPRSQAKHEDSLKS